MILTYISYVCGFYMILNRIFLFYYTYNDYSSQRIADQLYINDFCSRLNVDHLSDYTNQCIEAKRRLGFSLWILSLEHVVNDLFTLNMTLKQLVTTFTVAILAIISNNIISPHLRQGKSNYSFPYGKHDLPSYKVLKND